MFEVSVTTIICVVLSFVISGLYLRRTRHKRYPPGPWGFPIVGHLPLFGEYPPAVFQTWIETYGSVFRIRMGSWNTVVVNGFEALKAAAELPGDAFSGRPHFVTMQVLSERIGEDSLAFGNFSPTYVKQRKLVATALRMFTFKRHLDVEDLVYNEARLCADRMLLHCSNSPGSVKFDIQIMIATLTYQFLYGRDKNVDIDKHVKVIADSLHEFNEFSGRGNPLDVMPWLSYIMPWKKTELIKMVSRTDKIMNDQIAEHYNNFSHDNISDVTDAILASDVDDEQDKKRYALTRARLNHTIADLQGAAYETTQTTIRWLLIYMSAFPLVQERVYDEIFDIIGSERRVNLADRPKLVFVDAVIHEVLRIATNIPFALPHYAIRDAKICGFHVDAGTVVLFNLHSVHHEKDFWGDPEAFRPERFILDDNTLDTTRCSRVIPFSLGRRRCVGEALAKMNMFIIFTTLVQRCKFVQPPGESTDLKPNQGLVYYPKEYNVLINNRVKNEI